MLFLLKKSKGKIFKLRKNNKILEKTLMLLAELLFIIAIRYRIELEVIFNILKEVIVT